MNPEALNLQTWPSNNHFAGGDRKQADAVQSLADVTVQTPKGSWLGAGSSALQQAWSFVTDEAAAVAAEGPDGVGRAAQHHVPMPKPYLQFNVQLQGVSFRLIRTSHCTGTPSPMQISCGTYQQMSAAFDEVQLAVMHGVLC